MLFQERQGREGLPKLFIYPFNNKYNQLYDSQMLFLIEISSFLWIWFNYFINFIGLLDSLIHKHHLNDANITTFK